MFNLSSCRSNSIALSSTISVQQRFSSLDIIIGQKVQFRITSINSVVDAVETRCFWAWNSIFWRSTSKCELIEECLVATEEGPLLLILRPVFFHYSVADMEYLAVIVYIGVISVIKAGKGCFYRSY